DIEIIHKKLLTVIGSAERPFGYWTALVHKRFRF
ncbi:membrane protein, partial [Lacticaseibacillus paracasei]